MSESPFDNIKFPGFSELPFRKGDPDKAIWGFYEHVSGSKTPDELGALNLLTEKRILKASRTEIQTGKVCSLNWAMHKPAPPSFGRKGLEHKIKRWPGPKPIIDDEIGSNTQSGSQWDGFRHFGTREGLFYNGLPESEIVDSQGDGLPLSPDKPQRNGIHAFQGKIVGRGVLLDYYSYAKEKGIHYSAVERHLVTAEDLEACAKAQNLTFETGDILFVRMGYVDWYENASEQERTEVLLKAYPPYLTGIRQEFEEVEWFWNRHFAAVAADTPSFEGRPSIQEWDLHEYLLSLWGTPIGELFDLEELARTCKALGRYSFFVTSSPLHVVNGIASPPNSPLSLFQSTKSLTVMAEDVAIADDIARSSLHQGESPASPESKDEGLDKFGESAVDPEEDELENLPIWSTYNQEAIKADASMVEGSHREIDVLLVFTGLFSAVLTTFIIQTYQMILPDPIDETNQLLGDLKNITLQLAAVQMAPNIQTLTPLRQSSNGDAGLPDSQIEWVNGLWFAALACSLSAALVSMLAKQWLYAYTRGISGSPRDRARKRQNRFIQFRSWHVLTVINCLPLLLHAALFLFFGGIVVLLWQEKLVPISVATIVIVALAYIFYAGSMWISLVSPDCPYQHPISTHLHDWLKPSRDRHASCRTGKRRSRLIRSEPTWNLDENTQEKE
ncbi:hypothetical protein NP233_g9690 [Leucocoprinus birnbaumii]|uniref:DUF6535 domain-containing protein n=1 Tax=Leucocoprinus birnbaumii TaxID=56174 RepID=A0AAD5VJZ1_9AGAR|nr:hypothetical protein NP233_g9690 [Leucocoprinus birnbaumii]